MLEQSFSNVSGSLFQKVSTCIILGLEFCALLLLLGNGGNIPWFPPVVVFSLVGISLLSGLLFPFFWQYLEKKQRINSIKVYGFLYSAIRYCIAFTIAGFGWKKFYGLQFIVPDEIAKLPMNQQSGEWLTWFYFGYSHTFGIIIALIQITGGYLLLFRRTLLAGALILFSVLFNLTLINVFYQMNAGALLQSVLLSLGILFLILLDYKKLVAFFLQTKSTLPTVACNGIILKNVLRFSAIALSLLFTIYLKALMH